MYIIYIYIFLDRQVITKAVIGVPVNCDEEMKDKLKTAALSAGFNEVLLLY